MGLTDRKERVKTYCCFLNNNEVCFYADLSAAAVVAGGEEASDDEAEDEEDEADDHHGGRGQGQSATGAAASTFFTLIKKNIKFSLYLRKFRVEQLQIIYMRKGFLISEEMRKYLVIYEEAGSHI
jgi:hypothetical protein